MSRDDWYRNVDWNPEIASAFDAKIRRARDKSQYLRIQASILSERHPDVAHTLLDRYFELGQHFDTAQAYVDRATAFLAQANIAGAIGAYEQALARESVYPNSRTQAYVDFPLLVAVHRVSDKFQSASDVLDSTRSRLTFPVDYFKWNAAKALLACIASNPSAASAFARAAIDAAARDSSGFRYHPTVGLVSSSLADIRSAMERLCDA